MMTGGRMLLLIGLVITILYLLYYQVEEGFETLDNLSQDRTNPLAVQTNPLRNPAAPIGISEKDASKLRSVTSVALGGNLNMDGIPDASPRIDSENSYLGLVKFCMERGAQPNPFSDAKFRENCGMCSTSGTIRPFNTAFNKPTGVLVYKKDKDAALQDQKDNRYPFPRIIPSLNSATCLGASLNDSAQPVLAITQRDAEAFMKRADCVLKGSVDGTGCASCLPTKKISFVDKEGRVNPLTLTLFGEGDAEVVLGNRSLGKSALSMTQGVELQLGSPKEGTMIRVTVSNRKNARGMMSLTTPYLFGVLKGQNPNETPYYLDLYDCIEKNIQTGSRPQAGRPQVFQGTPLNLVRMNAPPRATQMNLEGRIPLTFTEWSDIASYDCPNGPFITTEASAEMLIRDPCLRPKGQGPLTWTDECLRSKLEDNRCASGTWYQNPQQALALWRREVQTNTIKNAGDFFKSFSTWLQSLLSPNGAKPARVETDIAVAMGVKGVDLRTPCDPFLNTNAVPNQACMEYLYKNRGATNKRVGPTYSGFEDYEKEEENFEEAFTTMATVSASDSGAFNPRTASGMSIATRAAISSGTGTPFEKVRRFYNREWTVANDKTKDLNVIEEAKGGRQNAYTNMLGIPIAATQQKPVSRNASGKIVSQEVSSCVQLLPTSFTPTRNRSLANFFPMRRDYTLSFTLFIRSFSNGWMNIFHMSQKDDMRSFGDRALAMWIFPGRPVLHIRFDNRNQLNNGIDTDNLPLNQPIRVQLEQRGSATKLVANNKTYTLTNNTQRFEGNVTVWGSDPWYAPANVTVSDFCLTFL